MIDCKWLPDLLLYDDYESWDAFQDELYRIFCEDFKNSYPVFENKRVKIRYNPIEFGKEEGFFHVTCQDYQKDNNRVPDFRRCERIRWVRKFIENYKCNLEECEDCEGMKVWEEPYKMYSRVHILLEEERYMVVIERRENYCLLITGFYFDREHQLRKTLKRYETYKAKSASQSETPSGTPSTTGK